MNDISKMQAGMSHSSVTTQPSAPKAQSVSSQRTPPAEVLKLPGTGSSDGTKAVDTGKEAEKLAQELQEIAQQHSQRSIKFSVNENSGNTTITVSDKVTGDIIREIPSEAIQELQAHIAQIQETIDSDKAIGLLFKGSG